MPGITGIVIVICACIRNRTVITITISSHKVYLPLVLRDWPPIPEVPKLNPIDNGDIDGSYDIRWNAAPLADSYVLEEARDSAFVGAGEIYTGPNTCYHVDDRGPGWYYYRVKGCNGWGCSDWYAAEVSAWLEQEDNDSCSQANGPLTSGEAYYGYPDDLRDWFKINVGTSGQVAMTLDNHVGEGAQLQLWDESGELVCRDWTRPLDKRCDVSAGWYYVCVKTTSGYTSAISYTLHVTFP